MANNAVGQAMLLLLKRLRPGYTVHGLRSTFRDWATDKSVSRRAATTCLWKGASWPSQVRTSLGSGCALPYPPEQGRRVMPALRAASFIRGLRGSIC